MSTFANVSLRNSLATQLLTVVFSIYFLIAFTVTSIHMMAEYYSTREAVIQDLKIFHKTFAPSVTNIMWDYQFEKLPAILRGMIEIPIVVGIIIQDPQGKVIELVGNVYHIDILDQVNPSESYVQNPKIEIGEEQDSSVEYFWHKYPLTYSDPNVGNQIVGSMTIYSSTAVVFKKLRNGFLFILINAVIKTLALWILFIWIGRRMLTRPLGILIKATEQLNLENLENVKIWVPTNGHNELKLLEESFNLMLQKLSASKKDIDALNLSLEQQVIKRTQALVQSEKMASIGTLVAGVAHEINNPANYIVLSASMLEKSLYDFKKVLFELVEDDSDERLLELFNGHFEELFKSVTVINQGCSRINEIVQALRTFSKFDQSEKTAVDLVERLKSSYWLIHTQFRDLVSFEFDFQTSVMVKCWPGELNQVFISIMMNACQSIQEKVQKLGSKDTKKSLIIRTQLLPSCYIVQFEDTGCGMTEEIRRRVFEPFFTTRKVGSGKGLGLSICFSIIQRHQGQITIESQYGIGTKVTISLPIQNE